MKQLLMLMTAGTSCQWTSLPEQITVGHVIFALSVPFLPQVVPTLLFRLFPDTSSQLYTTHGFQALHGATFYSTEDDYWFPYLSLVAGSLSWPYTLTSIRSLPTLGYMFLRRFSQLPRIVHLFTSGTELYHQMISM
jgi:hypothetical protein